MPRAITLASGSIAAVRATTITPPGSDAGESRPALSGAANSPGAEDQLLRRARHLQKLAPLKSGIPQHSLVLLHCVCVAGRGQTQHHQAEGGDAYTMEQHKRML